MSPGDTALRCSAALLATAAIVLAAAGCGGAAGGSGDGHALTVVAGESFWGSIASQLAGSRATVRSIIADPAVDPHSYQATAADARTIAASNVAIVNGLGYDHWMSQLLAADPSAGRHVVNVGDVLGLKPGDNPHQWYSPTSVLEVVDAIVAALGRVDPAGRSYFMAQRQFFLKNSLSEYDRLRDLIRARYAGVPVGYSESIFQPLGQDLGLRLLTPSGFARAIAEGTDVSAADKLTVDRQAQQRQIGVWIYNSQNETPDVQQVNEIATARHIPIVRITETLSPRSSTFQQWQVAQLRALAAALHTATGR